MGKKTWCSIYHSGQGYYASTTTCQILHRIGTGDELPKKERVFFVRKPKPCLITYSISFIREQETSYQLSAKSSKKKKRQTREIKA
jgi:hypothetical protein